METYVPRTGPRLPAVSIVFNIVSIAASVAILLSFSHGPGRETIVGEAQWDSVPVRIYDRGPSHHPSVCEVPLSYFHVDERGLPAGLCGPRVKVVQPEFIIVEFPKSSGTPPRFVSNTLPIPVPDRRGGFAALTDPTLLGMTTAFVTANRVIEDVERWVGHRVNWGTGGQLSVVVNEAVTDRVQARYDCSERAVVFQTLGAFREERGCVEGFTGIPTGWHRRVRNMVLDPSASPDAVAHEAAHAALAELKPGMFTAMGTVLHEALADMTAFLTALGDRETAVRVLAETGGDLRRENEASRLFEDLGRAMWRFKDADPSNDGLRYLRLLCDDVALEDFGLGREASRLPDALIAASVGMEFHNVSQVLAAALHSLFSGLYEEAITGGMPAVEAVMHAREILGTLMFRAVVFIGEYSFSFRDYAHALIRADRMSYGSAHEHLLIKTLRGGDLIGPDREIDDHFEEVYATIPPCSLSPAATEPADILAAVEELAAWNPETEYAEGDRWFQERAARGAMLRRAIRGIEVMVGLGRRWLYSDRTSPDGVRRLVLEYYLKDMDIEAVRVISPPTPVVGGLGLPLLPAQTSTRFMSMVFDADGALIDLHVDDPQQ